MGEVVSRWPRFLQKQAQDVKGEQSDVAVDCRMIDPEVAAMAQLVAIVRPMDAASRDRVIRYLNERFIYKVPPAEPLAPADVDPETGLVQPTRQDPYKYED